MFRFDGGDGSLVRRRVLLLVLVLRVVALRQSEGVRGFCREGKEFGPYCSNGCIWVFDYGATGHPGGPPRALKFGMYIDGK